MSSISVSSLVLGSLTMEVEGADASLSLSVLATAPAVLSVELGTPGAQGDAATIAVGTTTTLAPGSSATVANAGTSSAAVFNFGIPAGQTGATGATGSQGPAGTAATIEAGTTTTGAPGSSASVTNSGTSGAAVFDFTIPRGDVGATGATGATGPAGPGVAAGGTTGQFLSKASGASYDTTWSTIVPGDRYLTTSTTSLTINNANKTLTVGTGLSYTPTQNITISFDASHHMHGEVLTYDSGTGVMTVDVNHHTGSGTYSSWVVNVGGVTPATSTAWGSITGTISAQVDLQGSLDSKLATASNLSDLANAGTARTNLGLGTAAVEPATKLVPAGGTTGQVLSKVSATSWDLQWATAGGGGGSTATVYDVPGTYSYTIPAGATNLTVYIWGAGGGGGGGARNATTAIRTGGGGGGPGGYAEFQLRAASLTSPVTVVVPAGGNSGAGAFVNTSTGSGGSGNSTKASFAGLVVTNGNGGLGGAIGSTSVNGGTAGPITNYVNQAGNSSGGAGQTTTGNNAGTLGSWALPWPAGGGGGGGNPANVTTTRNGGNGGTKVSATANNSNGNNTLIAGGAGGIPASAVLPTAGQTYSNMYGGMGGGGGGYLTATAGQNGANGGQPGGGGGGGGAADNGFNGGNGGVGGAGMVIIFAY